MHKYFLQNDPSKPSEALLDLLYLTKVIDKPCSFEKALAISQEKFLRKKGTERYELKNSLFQTLNKKKFFTLFEELGLIHPINPNRRSYEALVVLGTTFSDFLLRLNFASSFNLDTTKYYFLTGTRPLNRHEKKKFKRLFHSCSVETEDEMIREITKNLLPFHKDKVLLTSSFKGDRRANTRDTLIDFLETKPKAGHYLLISSQPFAYCQYLQAKNLLHERKIDSIVFSVAAPDRDKTYPISAYLDTIARTLYELKRSVKNY